MIRIRAEPYPDTPVVPGCVPGLSFEVARLPDGNRCLSRIYLSSLPDSRSNHIVWHTEGLRGRGMVRGRPKIMPPSPRKRIFQGSGKNTTAGLHESLRIGIIDLEGNPIAGGRSRDRVNNNKGEGVTGRLGGRAALTPVSRRRALLRVYVQLCPDDENVIILQLDAFLYRPALFLSLPRGCSCRGRY